MSSRKLNDPAAPMYRRNYRTHLALEPSEETCSINEEVQCVGSDSGSNAITGDDQVPLLTVTPETSSTLTEIPIDHYHFVKYAFLLLGVVTLLPWNFSINASKYWMFKLRDAQSYGSHQHSEHKTKLQAEFFSMTSIVSSVPCLIVLYFSAIMNKSVPQGVRNIGALAVVTILFATVTIFVLIDTDGWQHGFYRLTLEQMFLISCFGAWYQSGVMGLAAIFPHEYTHLCIIGQSFGGVLASVVEIIVLLSGASTAASALIYFVFALFILISSVVVISVIQTISFFKFYVSRAISQTNSVSSSDESFNVKVRTYLLVRKTWRFSVALMLIYIATFGVFPGVLVHVEPLDTDDAIWGNLFSPVSCFLVFNSGDFCGRLLCSRFGFPAERESLFLGISFIRLLLTPLLLLCNIVPRVPYLPILFRADFSFVVLNALFALSNGYLTSVAMMYAPKRVDFFLRERVGTIMVFALVSGMSLGSILSLVIIKLFFPVST
ncbi:equilibrative nucleoside transporter 1 [Galendromus occidentalis]|uniref:Equilibrative nucleoside transporter 1 n=1 Tax=Galendromus occidentalis TaxID=34638 RepID=A0AAJ7SG83_9ACAR|nr:equilibrative nucleoside transporter 1 [Galendromus occidentalis]